MRRLADGRADYLHLLRDSSPQKEETEERHSADTSPVSKYQQIISKRGAFSWLAVYYSNDLVHGSWWFVYGSMLATLMPVVALVEEYMFYEEESSENHMPLVNIYETWILLILSGVFFTFGSYAFVRAFEDPPLPPTCGILKNDELLGAFLFFIGTIPYVPYFLLYFYLVWWELVSVLWRHFLFVLACIPTSYEQERRKHIMRLFQWFFGSQHWIIYHVQSDWLAGTWAFLIASVEMCVASFALLCYSGFVCFSYKEVYFYALSILDTLLFSIGSAYFVAGSYPTDPLRCYRDEYCHHANSTLREFQPHEIDMQTGFIDDL